MKGFLMNSMNWVMVNLNFWRSFQITTLSENKINEEIFERPIESEVFSSRRKKAFPAFSWEFHGSSFSERSREAFLQREPFCKPLHFVLRFVLPQTDNCESCLFLNSFLVYFPMLMCVMPILGSLLINYYYSHAQLNFDFRLKFLKQCSEWTCPVQSLFITIYTWALNHV